MEIDIVHDTNLNTNGKGFTRNAVRALIYNSSQILLIYSSINKDYKLPGGGVEFNETHKDALQREIKEECGLDLKNISNRIGRIIEYRKPQEGNLDYFKMESTYYLCEVKDFEFKDLNLDDYERELDFHPVWICVDEAIKNNKKIMDTNIEYPRWTKRDTKFLEYIYKNKIIKKSMK